MGSTGFYPENGPVTAVEVGSLWVDDHPVTNYSFPDAGSLIAPGFRRSPFTG